ncbi:unnamed protein product [Rotaria magnacalcarata]|uniref:N-acetyltransferase domain-containing protein n=1 Tax=Rotaria magnacalcarata TaxID=392030 RepID=A0A819E069_9BILA|nr:unnamed protein product [Rotaria magnacalcarata]CAF1249229.1 unnamed protein product [Rotaria magnacalcarata]CAF1923181.1 unnamed protein product [Rotaria magnacalcarata]CAF1931832.1 unnamed protein product [Rotaria magnacalcarata]CAF2113214.1 unnamed protein product [Rotaria magnacalcarata]
MLSDSIICKNNLVSSNNNDKSAKYRIRRMLDSDVNTLVKIEQITWPFEAWTADTFFHYLDEPFTYCWILVSATNNHSVLGYAIQYFISEKSQIANLCIHPDQRGRGLGGILLHHMINYAHQFGYRIHQLEVNTSNIHAYRLYNKYGFKIVGMLRQYYSDGADAYDMRLIVDEAHPKM